MYQSILHISSNIRVYDFYGFIDVIFFYNEQTKFRVPFWITKWYFAIFAQMPRVAASLTTNNNNDVVKKHAKDSIKEGLKL